MFFCVWAHVAIDRNSVPEYNSLLLWLIHWDILSACPHRQFHTLSHLCNQQVKLQWLQKCHKKSIFRLTDIKYEGNTNSLCVQYYI